MLYQPLLFCLLLVLESQPIWTIYKIPEKSSQSAFEHSTPATAHKIPEKSSQSAFQHSTPVNAHSRVSENTTNQAVEAQNMSDARRKLAVLCARKVSMVPSVPRLSGQQLSDHSGNAPMDSDSIMDALKVINSNITAYMVS